MKLKKGDKVKIIQRKSGNTTGSENCGKPNGDVGSIGFITAINRDSSYCVEDGRKYYGWFDKDDLELLTDEFILPEKWCVKVGDPATKSVFDKWRRSNTTYSGYAGSVGYLNQNGFFSSEKLNMGVEITFEQFKTHVLKETMEPKQEDLTGRWLKALVNYPQSTDCKKDEYVKIKRMRSDTSVSGYTVVLDDRHSLGATHFKEDLWELMPEGFDPGKPTFEVGKWYKNLGANSMYIGKLCGEVSEDRFPCKEYISDEEYTDDGSFFSSFKNAVLLTDLSEIQQYLPDGHVDKVQAIPEYVKCTVTWMNNHTLGTIYKVYKDGYVENDNKERSVLTWNGGGFEKSTKEAYDAQQDPNVFKAGTYIVLLASCDGKDCWKSSMPINHCYILKSNSHSLDIHIKLDAQGSTNNGWSCGSYYDSKMKIRAATPKEIAEYDRLGKPYDVTTLGKGKVKGEVDMKDIQRQCKEKYPIGSIVEDINCRIEHCLEDDGCLYSIHGNQIYSIMGKGLLYDNGKWATLVRLPESKKSESLLEEAKRRYPVGTKFMPAHTNSSEYCIVTDDCKFDLYSGGITSRITTVKNGIHEVWVEPGMHPKYGNTSLSRMVYYDGKWAEIVPEESKPEKYIPKVGDWVITKNYSRDYDGKPLKINKINDGIFCFFDEVNFYEDYNKSHNFHIDKAIRKAEPHEIPKTEKPIQSFVVGKWYKNHPEINTYAKCLETTSSGFKYQEAIFTGEYQKGSVSTWGKHSEMIEASLDEIQEFLPNFHPDKVFVSTKSHGYTPEEALAELKRRGFKKGVKYVYMSENGTYDEKDIRTANYDPCIAKVGDYIDCGGGYLWSRYNPSHLHRGPLLNSCDKIPLTVPQVSLWGEPASSTPNYLDPSSLLKKVQLPI